MSNVWGLGWISVVVVTTTLVAAPLRAGDPSPSTDSVWLNDGYPLVTAPSSGNTYTANFAGEGKVGHIYTDVRVVVSIRRKLTVGGTTWTNVVNEEVLTTSATGVTSTNFKYYEFAGLVDFD